MRRARAQCVVETRVEQIAVHEHPNFCISSRVMLVLLVLTIALTACPSCHLCQDQFQEVGDELQVYDDEARSQQEDELIDVENIRPWIIVPIPIPRVTKKALTVLSRWRPLSSYIQAAATAVAASVAGPTKLDFVSAEPRSRAKGKGLRQRPRVQPLRWGRRKRID